MSKVHLATREYMAQLKSALVEINSFCCCWFLQDEAAVELWRYKALVESFEGGGGVAVISNDCEGTDQ